MAHIRIALSQFRPNKGEYAENVTRIGAVITQAAQLDPKPDLVVFPETATSGYFVEGGVKELAVTAGTLARDLAAGYQGPAIDVVVGFYERFQNHIYNSALYVTFDNQTGLNIAVPANNDTTSTLTGTAHMDNTSDNGCQGATFTIPVSITGASQ